MEEENPHDSSSDPSETPLTPPQPEKKHHGPRPLDAGERRNAKFAFTLAGIGILAFFLQMTYFIIFDSFSDWICVIIFWIVYIMPGYLANAGMLIWGGGPPMDLGHNWKDGKRIFGPGKTWRGFFGGALGFGIPIALFVHWILYMEWGSIVQIASTFIVNDSYRMYSSNPKQLINDLALYLLGNANATSAADANTATFLQLLPRVILCSFGAPLGDLTKSFFKRRRGLDRGEPWWYLDQIDFILGCLLLSGWFIIFNTNIEITIQILIMLLVITPTITVTANTLSYLVGKKKVPW